MVANLSVNYTMISDRRHKWKGVSRKCESCSSQLFLHLIQVLCGISHEHILKHSIIQ